MKRTSLLGIGFLGCFSILQAQVLDAPAPAQPAATPSRGSSSTAAPGGGNTAPSAPAGGGGQSAPGSSSSMAGEIPFFDPGTETITFAGRTWNINNNRVFQAMFERYLNAPEDTTKDDQRYQEIVQTVLKKLAPQNFQRKNLDDAFALLPQASIFKIDARHCDELADAVYSFWKAKQEHARLAEADASLEQQRRSLEWNAQQETKPSSVSELSPPKDATAAGEWQKMKQLQRDARMQPLAQRLVEINVKIAANKVKREVSEIQAKIEFQALIVQLFLQRRFQHVLMATRFYRQMTSDGDSALRVEKDTKAMFTGTTGMPPTVGTLDSMANEAMHTVREGVEACQFLLSKNELESASKRLAETFVIGEYMPEIRTLPREQKRQALLFTQKSNQLISAIDVKDYALAEKLVKEINEMAKDCDTSKATAAIETARTISAMHIGKAKDAAVSGDKEKVETELRTATEIWPRNPAIAEVFAQISEKGNELQQALLDFDRLLSQHNHQQIWDDKMRFIAATAFDSKRKEQLAKVLDDMQAIETALVRCRETAKAGNKFGAWENAERVSKEFSDNNKLNQLRADLTTQAADFVLAIATAKDLEAKDQIGSSMAWYLKAQRIYPPSEFAQEGMQRLLKKIMPSS